MSVDSNIRCPACQGPLLPVQLCCDTCDLNITGRFQSNEFATLSPDDLHFLRIFIHCEGRIRDMESALGVSYPTIKSRLANLKQTLAAAPSSDTPQNMPAGELSSTLSDLQSGRLSFDQALQQLKNLQKKGDSP